MKIVDLDLNYDEIRKRIEFDKDQYKVNKWAELTGTSRNVISNIHGKSGKHKPSLQYIIAVAKVTGKPVEWYLYGTAINEPKVQSFQETIAQWPDEVKNACLQVKEILLSNHPIIKPMLLSNLFVYQHCVKSDKPHRKNDKLRDEEIQKLRGRIKFLEDWYKAGGLTGTDAVASSSTGKSKT